MAFLMFSETAFRERASASRTDFHTYIHAYEHLGNALSFAVVTRSGLSECIHVTVVGHHLKPVYFQMKSRQYEITSRHYREAEPNLWLL